MVLRRIPHVALQMVGARMTGGLSLSESPKEIEREGLRNGADLIFETQEEVIAGSVSVRWIRLSCCDPACTQ